MLILSLWQAWLSICYGDTNWDKLEPVKHYYARLGPWPHHHWWTTCRKAHWRCLKGEHVPPISTNIWITWEAKWLVSISHIHFPRCLTAEYPNVNCVWQAGFSTKHYLVRLLTRQSKMSWLHESCQLSHQTRSSSFGDPAELKWWLTSCNLLNRKADLRYLLL